MREMQNTKSVLLALKIIREILFESYTSFFFFKFEYNYF